MHFSFNKKYIYVMLGLVVGNLWIATQAAQHNERYVILLAHSIAMQPLSEKLTAQNSTLVGGPVCTIPAGNVEQLAKKLKEKNSRISIATSIYGFVVAIGDIDALRLADLDYDDYKSESKDETIKLKEAKEYQEARIFSMFQSLYILW